MSRLLAAVSLLAFTGLTLLLAETRRFERVRLAERLTPYSPGHTHRARSGVLSVATFGEVVVPLSQMLGEHLARAVGVSEDVSTRLHRVHSPMSAAGFRVRQVGWAAAAMIGAAIVATAIGSGPAVAVFLVLGAPLLVALLQEQRLAAASATWQRRVFLELPVVAEQLGMLTTAGWSLSGAMSRISERGHGCCAADLRRATARIRQGLSESDALQEWARSAEVEALDRLVSVLAMNRETADLGRLVSEEARSIRRDAQRELIEAIEQRNQQVWIPVTVAALVPGVLLMGVPFVDALSLFAASG